MSKTLVIWFIGSNAVGKTTQAALLHRWFRKKFGKQDNFFDTNGAKFHQLSTVSANLGKFYHPRLFKDKPTTATCGTDTISGKDNTIAAFEHAKQVAPIVIVEGIMATGAWGDFIFQPDHVVFLVHLDCSDDTLFSRLRQRRGTKLSIPPSQVEIKPKTQENLLSKLRGFRSLYHRMKINTPYHFSMNTDVLDVAEIHAILKVRIREILEEASI